MTSIPLGEGVYRYDCDQPGCFTNIIRHTEGLGIQERGWQVKLGNGKWLHFCDKHYIEADSHGQGPASDSGSDVPIQSEVFQAMYRMDPMVLLELGRVLLVGERSHNDADTIVGQENWRRISFKDHFNHAFIHLLKDHQEQIYGEEVGDDEAGEHLLHAMCRLMFAMAVRNMDGAHVTKN